MAVISGPALGADFFDREEEVNTILRSLRNDNILLVAPRRYGKTSVVMRLKILECVGEPYIPYFISIFLSTIFEEDERWLKEEDIEELYTSKLLGAHGRGYFDYYKQRLGIYYGQELARAAEDILREVCLVDQGYPKALAFDLFRRATGIKIEEKFINLLHDLENDFYITVDGEHIRFQSKVLRDWWRLYNV